MVNLIQTDFNFKNGVSKIRAHHRSCTLRSGLEGDLKQLHSNKISNRVHFIVEG